MQQHLAEQRPEAETAPDRQPIEAEDAPAPRRRRHVDDPGRAGGVEGALSGAEDEAGEDQAMAEWDAGHLQPLIQEAERRVGTADHRAGRRHTSSKRTRRCEVKRKRIDLVAGAQIDLGHDRVMAGDTSDARAVFRFSLSRLLKFPFIFTTTCSCFIATSIKSIAA